MPESQRNKIAVGIAGLLLGLVFLIAGVIYYKKNISGERQDQTNWEKRERKSKSIGLQF